MLDVDKADDLWCIWCAKCMQDGNPAYICQYVVLLSKEYARFPPGTTADCPCASE